MSSVGWAHLQQAVLPDEPVLDVQQVLDSQLRQPEEAQEAGLCQTLGSLRLQIAKSHGRAASLQCINVCILDLQADRTLRDQSARQEHTSSASLHQWQTQKGWASVTHQFKAKAAKDAFIPYGCSGRLNMLTYQTPNVHAVKGLPVDACTLCAEFEGWRSKFYVCHVCA